MFLNEIFKEMDRAFGEFPHKSNYPGNHNQREQFSFQPQENSQNNDEFKQNNPSQQYNFNFKKTPKSEKDIFDV